VAISRASDSSIQDGLPKFNDIWDGTTATSAFDSIGSFTVSSAVSSITFSNIPQTYTHLQLRFSAKCASNDQGYFLRINGDTGSNYNSHLLYGNGSAAISTANSSWTGIDLITTTSAQFSIGVVDILDYTNTNKNKVVRSIGGYDNNGSGYMNFYWGQRRNTAAITSLTILEFLAGGNIQQNSHFTLYGIK
jgi:hypothetical protein